MAQKIGGVGERIASRALRDPERSIVLLLQGFREIQGLARRHRLKHGPHTNFSDIHRESLLLRVQPPASDCDCWFLINCGSRNRPCRCSTSMIPQLAGTCVSSQRPVMYAHIATIIPPWLTITTSSLRKRATTWSRIGATRFPDML